MKLNLINERRLPWKPAPNKIACEIFLTKLFQEDTWNKKSPQKCRTALDIFYGLKQSVRLSKIPLLIFLLHGATPTCDCNWV